MSRINGYESVFGGSDFYDENGNFIGYSVPGMIYIPGWKRWDLRRKSQAFQGLHGLKKVCHLHQAM